MLFVSALVFTFFTLFLTLCALRIALDAARAPDALIDILWSAAAGTAAVWSGLTAGAVWCLALGIISP